MVRLEELYEKAFVIHHRFDQRVEEIRLLLVHLKDFDCAGNYALKVGSSEEWSSLGVKQLKAGHLVACFNSLVKSKDPAPYMAFIEELRKGGNDKDFELVLMFMKFARNNAKNARSVYRKTMHAMCKCCKLTEGEEFVSHHHNGDL